MAKSLRNLSIWQKNLISSKLKKKVQNSREQAIIIDSADNTDSELINELSKQNSKPKDDKLDFDDIK